MKFIKPLRDQIVVERVELSKVSAGGIFLPGDTLDTTTARGKIITVGDGAVNEKTGELIPMDVSVGDNVIFHVTSGIKVSEDKEKPELFLMREEDILAIEI